MDKWVKQGDVTHWFWCWFLHQLVQRILEWQVGGARKVEQRLDPDHKTHPPVGKLITVGYDTVATPTISWKNMTKWTGLKHCEQVPKCGFTDALIESKQVFQTLLATQ